jgi:hypothetical protein
MLPAGVIQQVDIDDEVIHVDRTQDEIKDSPSSGAHLALQGSDPTNRPGEGTLRLSARRRAPVGG